MHDLVSHASHFLVRRALESDPEDGEKFKNALDNISSTGWTSLTLTFVGFLFITIAVSYMLRVVFVLAAIESDDQAYLIPTARAPPPAYKDATNPSEDAIPPAAAPLPGPSADPEVLIIPQKPITSSIRSTIHHLQSIGGFRARWRGFWFGFVWGLCYNLLTNLFSFMCGLVGLVFPAPFISTFLSRIALARWEMGWTQVIISQPSSKPWYRRTPPLNTWNKVWGATALNHLICLVATAIPIACFFLLDLSSKFDSGSEKEVSRSDAFQMLGLVALYIAAYWALTVPANVALVRVQASMLPPEEEAIVPFDRTFGGRVVMDQDGVTKPLGFFEAWRSFNKQARLRILKLVLKTFAIQFGLTLLFGLAFVLELCYFVFPAFSRIDNPDDSL